MLSLWGVFLVRNLTDALAISCCRNKVALMDVAQRKILWCITERKGYVHHCTLSKRTLSYIQHICETPDFPYILHTYGCQDSLKVLDIQTGVLESSTGFPPGISNRQIKGSRAHPVRELIFITFCDEIMVFSTVTADWVGTLKLPALSTTGETVAVLDTRVNAWELKFDEYGPRSDTRNTVSVCRVVDLMRLGTFRLRCWIIHQFECPTVEELEIDNADSHNKEGIKLITNWKHTVEIIDCADTPISDSPEIYLRSKQMGTFLRPIGDRSTKAIISTFKEVESAPADLQGIHFAYAGPPRIVRSGDMEKETEIKIRWFSLSGLSEITKMRKTLPKDTPYAERRLPFNFSTVRQSGSPQLKERYMAINQGWGVLLFNFEPKW